MNKGITSGFGALVLLAALFVGSSYWSGVRFEARYRQSIIELSKTLPFAVEVASYDRGLFNSIAETRLTIPQPAKPRQPGEPLSGETSEVPATPEPIVLVLHHEITQGPRLDGFQAVRVRTTPVFAGEVQQSLVQIFKDQPLFESVNNFTFTGAVKGQLTSPPIETEIPAGPDAQKAGQLIWSGLSGGYTLSSDGRRLKFNFVAPRFSAGAEDDKVSVDDIRMTGDMSRGSVKGLWLGDSALTIATVAGTDKEAGISANGIVFKSTASEQDGVLKSTADFSAHEAGSGTIHFDKPLLRVSISNIDSASLYEFIEKIQAVTAPGSDSKTQMPAMMALLQQMSGRLLAHKPIMSIDELSVTMDSGSAKLNGQVQYIGNGRLDTFSPVTDVEGTLSMTMPSAMFDQLFSAKTENDFRHQRKELGETDADPRASALVSKMALDNARSTRETFVAQKLLTVDGTQLGAKVDYRGGVLLVNGAPFQGFGAVAGAGPADPE